MSLSQKLRLLVTERLNAVVEEILAAFEETLVKYEEEAALSQQVISRQHALLCALNRSVMDAPASDVFTQQLSVPKDDLTLTRQDQNMVLEPSHVGEQLQSLDAAEIIEFTYNSKSPVSLRGGFESASGPRSDQDVQVVLSSDTEDSDDYGRDPADARPAGDKPRIPRTPRDGSSCLACSRTFTARRFLFRHVRAHVHDPRPVCGLCGERFESTDGLKLHLQTHTKKKVLQNQAKTWSRERRLHLQRTDFNQSQETQQPADSSQTLPKKRRGRPPSNKNRQNKQKVIKKRKKKKV